MQLKMTILVILSVDLRIAEMMILEDGLLLRRPDFSIIDLDHSNQNMFFKYSEKNAT
jgi:hypothetical protein